MRGRERFYECPPELWFVDADISCPTDAEVRLNAFLLQRILAGWNWPGRELQAGAARAYFGLP